MSRRGGGMRLDPGNLMRQVQQMQQEVERIQTEVEQQVVTASAGGGAVEVAITGALEVQSAGQLPLGDLELGHLQTLADQIAIAIEIRRRYGPSPQGRRRQWVLIAKASQGARLRSARREIARAASPRSAPS